MMAVNRNRIVYGLLTISTALLGLASRRFFGDIPVIRNYAGDAVWALMVFFALAFMFNRWSTKTVTLVALLFSFGIESSQLYHASWIDNLRATRLGGLVLGFTFMWSDFVCYSIGIIVGVVIETYLIPERFRHNSKPVSQGIV